MTFKNKEKTRRGSCLTPSLCERPKMLKTLLCILLLPMKKPKSGHELAMCAGIWTFSAAGWCFLRRSTFCWECGWGSDALRLIPPQIIPSSAASLTPLCLLVVLLLCETLMTRAQSGSSRPRAVLSHRICSLICISNQIIVLMPIRGASMKTSHLRAVSGAAE